MLKNKRVFVSGGAGVIGQALVERLHQQGAILMVGDLKPRPSHWPGIIRYWQGDLNFISKDELEDFAPEYFFHLAATFERSVETWEFWAENDHHNVRLSHHLMTCLKDRPSLTKVIFASSYLIYDPEQYQFPDPAQTAYRLQESDVIYPRNLCGVAKLLHEIELRFLQGFDATGFDTVSARIFRVYGKNSKDVISRWIRSLLQGKELQVYNKEGMFDYIYAEDVAEGLIRLAESKATGVVNLGNDRARRVEEVLEVLRKHFPDMKTIEGTMDIPYEASQANMEYFKSLTGWTPTRQLENAIPEMIEFEKRKMVQTDESLPSRHILVTSISKKVPLLQAVRHASKKRGGSVQIFGADLNEDCIGRHFVDGFWSMPRIEELSIDHLVEYCKQNRIGQIIPTRDGELPFFACHKQELLEQGIHVMISEVEAIQSCLDKLAFYERLQSCYPIIPTSREIKDMGEEAFVVKERFGAGSLSIGLNLTREQALEHAQGLSEPIFQPYIKGEEYSVDLYVDQKRKTKGVVVRKRKLVVQGESQITVTCRHPELEELCSSLVEGLQLYGHIVMQVMIDAEGKPHIIEINPRFGGASTLSLAVGLDSFTWFLLEANGQSLDDYPFLRQEGEKKMVRYAHDLLMNVKGD
ncbi:NAD-dependent epimerase/dehydratase family protein [Ammoniphilus sp. CFH 90114]|uniref:NAD-dependent epimerase/dehydratase family protein n=1 Tax=Ammoniphilus sp. CFH 90114 TaxID=2493665 RepID=UPI00100E5DD4|nr:NAD-dependent epimerase/dehydratase family protein [Ammoniphilus sp. CFH 90114]RXT04461.1 NAD-dependent epimerase/dehydratase family protein [Ammoniphilus sp. CFH 90114]